MYNQVTLIGHLGRDPEVKYTPSGQALARFNLATTERWIDRDGNRQEATQWHSLVAWGKIAELVNAYLKKGSRILAEGKLTYREYEDRNGQKQRLAEIVVRNLVFLDKRKGEAAETNDITSSDDIPF